MTNDEPSAKRIVVGALLWGAGTIASSLMTLVVVRQLAEHGMDANLGWGVFGLMVYQPPATLGVLLGTALLWQWRPSRAAALVAHSLPVLGPYRTTQAPSTQRASRWVPRALLVAGLLWSCIAYLGLLFHNSGC